MKKIITGIIILIIIAILVPIGIYIWFSVGMVSANRAKPIDTSSIRAYKTDIEKEFSDITKVNIYYRFGRIIFDFKVNSSMSLDEYKSVVKKTKDFILKEGVISLLPKGYDEQETIRVDFNNKESIYSFESPYWIPTEDITDNPNNSVVNNYKVWYMSQNNEPPTQIEF